jgi:MFS family permease
MVGTLSRINSLLLAVLILLTGHGLQLTLLPVYADTLGWTTYAIATSGSAYFVGFVAGCLVIPSFVAGVGHIRVFMVMGAVATIALLATGLVPWLPAWIVFRCATGFALSGLYMVIESWLGEVSPRGQRGTVLATYTMISLLGMAVGQSLMGLSSPPGLSTFVIGAALLCLAIVPIGLTRVPSPRPLPSMPFSARLVARESKVAVVCALLASLVTGAFWTLGPVMGQGYGLAAGQVGGLMGAAILGGAMAQLPIGRLSDRGDRRVVIAGLMGAGATCGLAGWLFAGADRLVLYAAMFGVGATTMPVYALCIAHACDNTRLTLVEIASGILTINSIGSILGPLLLAALMDRFGASSFFTFVMACTALGAAWALYRHFVVERPREREAHAFILPRTTPVVAELSPEGEVPGDLAWPAIESASNDD